MAKKNKNRATKKKRKKNAPGAEDFLVEQAVVRNLPASDVVFTESSLLEICRTQWQYGEWDILLKLEKTDIQNDRDRGKLAALLASVQGHAGQMQKAKAFAEYALEWGCDRAILTRLMVSAAMNTLGRAASALGEDDLARQRFNEAIALVEPRADTRLLGRSRQVRETARMGLLPAAQLMIETDLEIIKTDPHLHEARMAILDSEIELLKHELSVSLQRGQLLRTDQNETAKGSSQPGEGLEGRAVSQLGQDLWVLERSNYKRGGFFVEFGATDGVRLSNTFLLEKEFGWTGICAEPNPQFFERLKQNRNCTVVNTCIGETTGETVEFVMADVYGGIMKYGQDDSHLDKRLAYQAEGHVHSLVTQSLNDFLEEHGAPAEIDYLSIDTEGSELAILRALPFDRWRIRLVTVEHNFTEAREKIHELMTAKGYRRTEASFDDWYELVTDP